MLCLEHSRCSINTVYFSMIIPCPAWGFFCCVWCLWVTVLHPRLFAAQLLPFLSWGGMTLPGSSVWGRSAQDFSVLYFITENFKHTKIERASLVAQWLRICLPMQETRVRALVWEDPTCHGAAGPVSHSC